MTHGKTDTILGHCKGQIRRLQKESLQNRPPCFAYLTRIGTRNPYGGILDNMRSRSYYEIYLLSWDVDGKFNDRPESGS